MNPETIYENIRRLCEINGISIKRLEEEVGIGNGVIGKWRSNFPRIDNLKKVASCFDCTVDELMFDFKVKKKEALKCRLRKISHGCCPKGKLADAGLRKK